MTARRLVDGLLVSIASRVQRWASRILAERNAVLQTAPLPLRRDEADPQEADPQEDEGPPAHWLEMVRARAPQLLSMKERAPRPVAPPTPARSPSPARSLTRASERVDEADAVPARSPSPARSPTPARSPSPARSPMTRSKTVEAPAAEPMQQVRDARAPALTRPSASHQIARQPADMPAELAPPPPRSEPPASAWSSPRATSSPSPPSLSPSPDGARAAERAAERARSPDARTPPAEPVPGRWRIEPGSEPSPTRGNASLLARHEMPPERPAPMQPLRAASRRPAACGPVPPTPAAPTSPRTNVPEAAPPAAPVRTSAPAGSRSLDTPVPNVPTSNAAPLAEPPPRLFDHAPDELPQDDRRPPLERSNPWRVLLPARSGLWPRLLDESDAPLQAWPPDATWPVLPSDDPVDLEAPVHGEEHDRSERLRGEQQGARWSERHS